MARGYYYGLKLYNLDGYIEARERCVKYKGGALSAHFDELSGIINLTKFSRRFFNKTHSWFSQRLHGSTVMNKEQSFKDEEYKQIAAGFRELAKQLNQYADELDRAESDI